MRIMALAGAAAVFAATAGYAASGPAPAAASPGPPAAFAKCAGCHATRPNAGAHIGPTLFGVGGAHAGARPGFAYSQGLRDSGLVWNRATIARFVVDPEGEAPGTAMPPQNLTPAEADAVAAYAMRLK